MKKLIIKIDGAKYYQCQNCGMYVKDKFDGKIKNQMYCSPCLSNEGAINLQFKRLKLKNVVNRQK